MTNHALRSGLLAAVSVLALGTELTTITTQPALAQSAQPAVLTSKGVWNANTTYAVDAVVTLRGSTWRSKVNNNKGKVPGSTNPNNAAFWEPLATGFNPRGNWLNTTTYQPNELVIYQGQTWRAKVTNTNVTPAGGANWELWVTKGAAGATGATGPAGPNTGIGSGSQGLPSISFNGDADTGIFRPETGKIALVENGQLFLHNKGNGNTALGLTALGSNTGSSNTAVGSNSMQSNTSGGDNTAVGGDTLKANTTGSHNAAFGNQALLSNESGSFNTALGQSTLFLNVTGANNTAVGYEALHDSTTADNTAVGYRALTAQTTGYRNTAVGAAALSSNTTGYQNIAIGSSTMGAMVSGNDNIAMGYGALNAATSGNYNIAIGNGTMNAADGGWYNVAIGVNALILATQHSNVAVGTDALVNLTTGIDNIAIGTSAGASIQAGSSNIMIGNLGTSNDTHLIRIGGANQTQTFIAGIAGVNAGDTPVFVDSTTGQLGIGPAPSSRRFKYEIEAMADMSVLLSKLRPVTYRYKEAKSDGSHPLQYGLIAEEVAELLPDLAMFDKDGQPNGVKYHLLPSFLLAGYQAQQKTIDRQAEKIASQGDEIAALRQEIAEIKAMLPRVTRAALQ